MGWNTSGGGGASFPGVVDGANLFLFGHSYLTGGNAQNSQGYAQLLSKVMTPNNVLNNGQAGQRFVGTAQKVVTYGTTDFPGFFFIDTGVNDFQELGDAANWPGGQGTFAADVLRTMVHTLRGAPRAENTAGTYTGTWTANVADANASGGSYHKTSTQNDFVDIPVTIPAGSSSCLLVFQAVLPTTPGATTALGANYDVIIGGTTVASGSTSYSAFHSSVANAPVGKLITGLTPGAVTIRIKKTDAGAGELRFDCAIPIRRYPATGVIVVNPQLPGSTATTIAGQAKWAAAIATVAAEFSSSEVVVVDPSSVIANNAAYYSPDNIHWNDRGHAFVLGKVVAALSALSFREGQNRILT